MKGYFFNTPILIKKFENENSYTEINNVLTCEKEVINFVNFINEETIPFENKKEEIIKFKKKYRINNGNELIIKSYKLMEQDCIRGIINLTY